VQEDCEPAPKKQRFSMEVLHQEVDQIPVLHDSCDLGQINALFDHYAEGTGGSVGCEQCIAGDSLSRLAKDFGWPDDTNCTYFALCYCMGSKVPNVVTRAEWTRAFCMLRCDTVEKAKRRLLHYQLSLKRNRSVFLNYFNYVFNCINTRALKCIDIHLVQRALIAVVGTHSPFTFSFCHFLNETVYRGLNSDQWRNFLSFSLSIRVDFSNYDINDAWPSIYDEYVDWVRTKKVRIMPQDME